MKGQKKQKQDYSGKKKRQTLKTQMIVNSTTAEIICTSDENGKCHDYRLFKNQRQEFIPE
ncbi:transposase family protein [Candidatus Protochlamydia sp. W-9]|uniref:transposase family protein n=1 Tax=Candidatus Protochlamydia sp. W-9 TaxID=1785087 RepID=UPI0013016552